MSEQAQSPWARPGTDAGSSGVVVYPPVPGSPADYPAGPTAPAVGPLPPSGRRPGSADDRPAIDLGPGWSRSGAVTALGEPAPAVVTVDKVRPPRSRQHRMMLMFGGAAGLVLVIGVIIMIILTLGGNSPLQQRRAGPPDTRPPLAKACPPPSGAGQSLAPAPPPPPGPRTVDPGAGISYAAQGAPWVPWSESWSAGDLRVRYSVGQHFVTEVYPGGVYHASILSGSVPAAENDALTLDLKCTGHQVLADVRQSYYPQPNTIDMMRDEVTVLGGRAAWVGKFRLHFHAQGLKASSELVGLALIDVGRPNAAVLYVSIPNTVGQYDPLVDQVLASVRPT